jgi:hypothetical protein
MSGLSYADTSDRDHYGAGVRGIEGVTNFFFWCSSEFLDAGDTVVVLGYYKATYKATGAPLNAQFAHIWRLRETKITAFQQYTDTAQAARAVHG